MDRWVGQPVHPRSPEDEEPKGLGQLLLTVCLPPTRAKRLSMSQRCRPGLVPLPIADRIAQHAHGVDVLPPEAACQPPSRAPPPLPCFPLPPSPCTPASP